MAKEFCSKACRPSIILHGGLKGTSGVFRVNGMTPAEYTFRRIMQDKGVTLMPLNQHKRMFPINGTSYTPDLYDPKTGIYYEVSGTRQAYHANKEKYALFREMYPTLTLNIVRPDGTPIEAH